MSCIYDDLLNVLIDYICIPVYNSEETGSCGTILQYPHTTQNSSLLIFETFEELVYGRDSFELSEDELERQTQTCQDALEYLACLMLQPECRNGSQIPLCKSTCRGRLCYYWICRGLFPKYLMTDEQLIWYITDLFELCPYELWEYIDIPCDMFPDSDDPEECTRIAPLPTNGDYDICLTNSVWITPSKDLFVIVVLA